MARRLNEDHSDHSGSTTACACGQTARYAGRRPKTFTSVLGPLTLERAYYYCDACRAGICPRDRALGLHATSLSPGVLRMVGLAASDFSFAAASGLLWELAAVRVETKQRIPSRGPAPAEATAPALGPAVRTPSRAQWQRPRPAALATSPVRCPTSPSSASQRCSAFIAVYYSVLRAGRIAEFRRRRKSPHIPGE